jgi:transposase
MMMDTDDTTAKDDTSTHTITRMSARTQRIEVITRGERRRRWSPEQKQAIVSESVSSDVPLTAIARKYGIGTGLLYSWRHQLLTRLPGTATCFARVELAGEQPRLTGSIAEPPGRIEIVLPGGTSVRVDGQVDEPALRRVLAALRG